MTNDIKDVFRKFENIAGRRIVVQERAGASVKHTAKPEPLRSKGCLREDLGGMEVVKRMVLGIG